MLVGLMGFCSKVSVMWVKCSRFILNLIGAFCIEFGGALSDWFLVNRRGFELQGLNQRSYGQICFNWVRGLACFLHNLGNEVA